MLNRLSFALAAGCFVLCTATSATELSNEDAVDERQVKGGVQCINSRPIRRTEVIHERAVIFYMRGAAIYVNVLPKACKRLARERRFMYESTAARLCKHDKITPLQDGGTGLTTGRACSLGNFYPITEEDVEKLKQPPKLEPEPVPPADPREPRTADKSGKEAAQE